jgi:hypothetical protein
MSAEIYGNLNGARIEIGTVTLDPGEISADSSDTETVTISGAESGDRIFIFPDSAFDAGLVVQGAKVTADDTVTIKIANVTESAVDGDERTLQYILLKK